MKWPISKATRVRTIGLNMLFALGKIRTIFFKNSHAIQRSTFYK